MDYNNVAAKWWADMFRNVGPRNFDNDDKDQAAMDSKPASEIIDKFQERLAETIKEHVEAYGSWTLSVVDYGPDCILSSLAQETGLSTNGFPRRTTIWIIVSRVSVRSGYDNSYVTIFPVNSAK